MRKRSAVPLLIFLASQVVAADDAFLMEPVVVTPGRGAGALLDLAGNTARMESAELELISSPHIDEVLARVPGAWLTRSAGTAGHLTALRSPSLNGPGACGAFLFMEEGITVSGRGFCNVNELFSINTEQAGAIEVMRGPGSAYYGSNALHGLVNVFSKPPSRTAEYGVSLEAGSFDFKRIKVTGSDSRGDQGWRLSALATDSGAFQNHAGLQQQKLSFRHDLARSDDRVKTLVSLMNLRDSPGSFVQGFENYRDRTLSRQNGNPAAYRDALSLRGAVEWQHYLNEQSSLRFTPYVRRNDMEFSMHWLPGNVIEKNAHASGGLQTAFEYEWAGGHRLLAGADLELTHGDLEEIQAGPDNSVSGFRRYQGKHYDYDVDVLMVGPFVHAERQLTPKLRMSGGVRYDLTQYDYTNNLPAGNVDDRGRACTPNPCLYNRPAAREDVFRNFSPQLGASYRLTPTQSLYAKLARGFRAPQTSELYRLQRGQQVADIDSERLDSAEIGARGVIGSFQYDTALFIMRKKNFIFPDSNFFMIDGGRTRHYGFETELGYRLTPALTLSFNGSYTAHKFAADQGVMEEDKDIPQAPKLITATRLNWVIRDAYRAELEWVHVGPYYLDEANQRRYTGHDLLHLRLTTQLTPQLEVSARLTNLTDEKYADRADFAFGDYRYFIGQPRVFIVGLQAMF